MRKKESMTVCKTKIPRYEIDDEVKRIALVAPGCWGDNINQTFQLKAVKDKYPNCTIDVHSSDRYAAAFYNNDYVDNIIEYESKCKNSALHLIHTIPPLLKDSNYSIILSRHPMIYKTWSAPKHPELGENLILVWAAQLDEIGIDYAVPLQTTMRLTQEEIAGAENFISRITNLNTSRNILMEVHAESGQTFWNDNWTRRVCEYFLQDASTNIFISRRELSKEILELNEKFGGRVYFVGTLSIRQCAHIFNYCQIFQSISSGLSNACNTSWCKKDITWLEVINSHAVSSAPMRKEGKHFWLKNNLDEYLDYLKSIGL